MKNESGKQAPKEIPGRFKKGTSGNPSGLPGRPRTKYISKAAEKLVAEKIPAEISKRIPELKGKTWAYGILYGQALAAVKGETPAANFVADRSEGKVRDEVEVIGGRESEETVLAKAQALLAAARARAKR